MATVNFSVPEDVKAAFDKDVLRSEQERGADGAHAPRGSRIAAAPAPRGTLSTAERPYASPHRIPTRGEHGAHCRSTVRVVLDASVILKWLLGDPGREPDSEQATALVRALVIGELEILEPFHWLAEVAAVLSRLSPESAVDDVLKLRAMGDPDH